MGPATLMASELAAKHPDNPFFKTTHALALFKRGDAAGALAVLDRLSPGERGEPVRELLRAQCLAALGRLESAQDLLDGAALADLLPEELRMASDARLELAERRRELGNRTRLLAQDGGAEPALFAWLDAVDEATRTAATTDMRLAESLQVAGDYEGLLSLLSVGRWQSADYLRHTLRAYVFRRADRLRESNEAWRQALALAGRDKQRLLNLSSLVTRWSWKAEQMDTLNRRFESEAGDRALLTQLRNHYRDTRSTSDLLRVLGLHLSAVPSASDEAVEHAYYSLLLNTNVARAEVAARGAFEAAPTDVRRRMVQAFSLLKQQRAAEALPLLAVSPETSTNLPELKPLPLLRAAVLASLGDVAAARASLDAFDLQSALPEEAALAERLARELAASVSASG